MKTRSGLIATLIPVLTALFVICSVSLLARAQDSSTDKGAAGEWIGEYEFFDAPPAARRNAPTGSITYKITVLKKASQQLLARLEANGFQTAINYECTVKISGGEMKLYFLNDLFGDGSEDFAPLKKGSPVASLTRAQSGKKTRYLFKPTGYRIELMSGRKQSPIYFTKSK